MRLARLAARAAFAVMVVASSAAGTAGVSLLASGVFVTAKPAWTAEAHLLGRPVRINVPGVVRLLTAPGMTHLLDGRSLMTKFGRLHFRREGRALLVTCAPCRFQHPRLASVPLVPSRVELRATRDDTHLSGQLVVDGIRVDFVAQLANDRIGLVWKLADAEVAAIYRALATVVPEAQIARIEGTVRAQGLLELPGGRSSLAFHIRGLEVGGLGTEALQFGWFRFACTETAGASRTIVSGDGESPWLALDRMGRYLSAAVIAAEDQRYTDHSGFDVTELATLMADLDGTPRRGASTLTQQLARTLYTGGERSAARKLRELLYAVEMERTLGKPRILELYLNTVHWGPGICGAGAAARHYFNKSPARLTPIEAAWLAGILRHPHAAHGEQFLPRAPDRERAAWVVQQMREFPRRDRHRWTAEPLVFAAHRSPARHDGEPKGPPATRR